MESLFEVGGQSSIKIRKILRRGQDTGVLNCPLVDPRHITHIPSFVMFISNLVASYVTDLKNLVL